MSVYSTDETDLTSKSNQKLRTIGTGTQLSSLPITYEGQLILCTTSSNSSFPQQKLRSRMTGNILWSGILVEGSETADSTHITVDFHEHLGGVQAIRFFTFPSTEKFYKITKIEWFNGNVVSGTVMAGVSLVNANPVTLNSTPLIAIGRETTQSGTSAFQSVECVRSLPVRGGSHIAIWLSCSDSVGKFGKNTGLTTQYRRAVGYTASPPTSWNTAFTGLPLSYNVDFICYYRGYS